MSRLQGRTRCTRGTLDASCKRSLPAEDTTRTKGWYVSCTSQRVKVLTDSPRKGPGERVFPQGQSASGTFPIKRFRRGMGKKPNWKKAIVTLRDGDIIDVFEGV